MSAAAYWRPERQRLRKIERERDRRRGRQAKGSDAQIRAFSLRSGHCLSISLAKAARQARRIFSEIDISHTLTITTGNASNSVNASNGARNMNSSDDTMSAMFENQFPERRYDLQQYRFLSIFLMQDKKQSNSLN